MEEASRGDWFKITLSSNEFGVLARFIEEHCGIRMPSSKKIMLESRLRKRLKELDIPSFKAYIEHVFSADGLESELIHMVDAVTTNKTDFFREPQHFDFLVKSALPELIDRFGSGVKNPLAVWSAGCSSGEEPYTLTIVLSEVAARVRGFDFFILATDISTRVLSKAARAIYDEERIAPVPMDLRKKYLLRSKDRSKRMVRIVPELRAKVRFRRLNFMDADFGLREPMDVIFCRNVFIYFDRETQERILNMFCKHLIPGGYVFLGHSESINGLDTPLIQVAPSAYRKPG